MLIAQAEVSELSAKGIDILPSMVEAPRLSRSASNHPDDANATPLGEDVKEKAAAEAKAVAEKTAREEADARFKRDVADGKIDPATGRYKNPADAPKADAAKSDAKADATKTGDAQAGDEQKAPKKDGVQKRIDELTRKAHDAHRARVAAEADAARWKKEAETARAASAQASTAAVPQRGDFATEDAYLAAVAAHSGKTAALTANAETRAADAEAKAADAAKAAKAAEGDGATAAAEVWKAKQEDARARYADYDAVTDAKDVMLSPAMAQIILSSEYGADLLYHFGKPDGKADAARIAEIGDPLAVAREIGRIEHSLAATRKASAEVPESGKKAVSDAPAPLSESKAGTDAARPDPNKMSMKEYVAARESGKLK
jgi:hypothetical protein